MPRPSARRRVLVRPCGYPRSLRQDAANPFLQPTFTSRALARDITSGDCPSSAVGNPPAFDFETAPVTRRFRLVRPGTAPDHLAVIRPPAAPCLTARRRLRPDRLPLSRCRAGGWNAQGLCRPPDATVDANLWHPFGAAGSGRRSAFSRSHEPVLIGGSSTRPTFPEPEVPSTVEDQRGRPLGCPCGALLPLAGGGNRCACSSRFENPD
jgi:hypothetical protein